MFVLYVLVCVCIYVHHMCFWCPRWPEESTGVPGTGDADSCEVADVYTGNETLVLYYNSKYP